MDIYSAVMKAADHIERNPHLFDFNRTKVPACGAPGCAIGWVAYFSGKKAAHVHKIAPTLFDCSAGELYLRLDEFGGYGVWQNSAALCARSLRLYAAKYLSPAKPIAERFDWQAYAAKLAREPRIQENASA